MCKNPINYSNLKAATSIDSKTANFIWQRVSTITNSMKRPLDSFLRPQHWRHEDALGRSKSEGRANFQGHLPW